MFKHHPQFKFGVTLIYVPLFLFVLFLNSCKKTDFIEPANKPTVFKDDGNLARNSDTDLDISGWLGDKQAEYGEAGSVLIERMLPLLRMDDKYDEPYGNNGIENFIVVPIDYSSELSEHIRTDLSEPLQYLLIVAGANGEIRRGDLIMFYPDSSISDMPANAFNQYFSTQTLPVDGTFQVVSLNNIKQYEMDIENSKPEEFRLWEGRHAVYDEDVIICIDWYLVTTYYYSNGTIEVFEDFLFTQCYGGSGGGGGGGGNGITPPNQNHYPVTKNVSFIVASLSTAYEGWSVYADYYLHGECYPNSSSQSYFTSPPEPVDGTGASTSHITFESGFMHSVAWHPWFLNFQLSANNVSLLNNNKTAKAQFSAVLSFPNQSPVSYRYPGNSKFWQASIALH